MCEAASVVKTESSESLFHTESLQSNLDVAIGITLIV